MKTRLLFAVAAAAGTGIAGAQVSFNGTYSQNFDHLDAVGPEVSLDPTAAIPGADGWYGRPGDDNRLLVSDGNASDSGLYSVGTVGSSERALGSKSGNSGTLFGLALKNTTGKTLTTLNVSFYGELWRDAQKNGSAANVNTLFAGYRIGGSAVNDGAITALSDFNLTSGSGVLAASQPLDGNANRTLKSGVVSGFSLAPGDTFWLTFRGQGYPRDEALFGVDDVTIVAPEAVPEPLSMLALATGIVTLSNRRLRRKSA